MEVDESLVLLGRPKRTLTIYKCQNCGSVLGNSDFLLGEYTDSKSIFLSEVENAVMSTSVKLASNNSKDKGCTFHTLECSRCHEEFGIHYISVTPAMQPFDKMYKLHITCIESVKTSISADTTSNTAELRERIDDLAVTSVNACLDRVRIKESITMLATLINSLKKQVDDLRCGNDSQTESA